MSLIIDTDLDRTLSEVDTMVPRDRLDICKRKTERKNGDGLMLS